MGQLIRDKAMYRSLAPRHSTMSSDPTPDPAVRLAAIMGLPEAEGLDEVAQILARMDLALSEVSEVLAATVRACHAAANEGGRLIAAVALDLPPQSDREARIAQAVADILCPLPQRH